MNNQLNKENNIEKIKLQERFNFFKAAPKKETMTLDIVVMALIVISLFIIFNLYINFDSFYDFDLERINFLTYR